VFTDQNGNVHIVDPERERETVVSPAFEVLAQRSFPKAYNAKVPLEDGELYVVNLWHPSAERIGFPLHIVRRREFLRSFGMADDASDPITAFSSRRVLTADGSGRIFSASFYDYLIEVWNGAGKRIVGFRGPVLNVRPPRAGAITDDNPPPNQVWAIQVDDQERLWVISLRTRDDWRAQMEEVLLPNGDLRLRQRDESSRSLYTARIDVIDLRTFSMIARVERQELITAFVGPGLGLEVQEAGDGITRLVVWRVSLATTRHG
jgi:hypothetical protein